ncbi:MAG TPA: hypothetical protein VLA77_01135 [Candidatus Saccharimonadales bacterium]|nr:hypothetical protein [Candidatus Saccharimonadales bacterium]
MTNLAHDSGVPHEEVEQIQESSEMVNSTANYLSDVAVNILPFAVLLILLILMTFVLKNRVSTRVNVTLIYLLIVGLTSYAVAPIASIISLIIGFGLALFVVLGRVNN